MITTLRRLLVSIIACLCVGLAHSADIDLSRPPLQVTPRMPAPLVRTGTERVLAFTTWKSAVAVGDIVGRMEWGLFCTDRNPLLYSKNIDDWLSTQLSRNFTERAVKLGFSQPEAAKSVFEEKGGGADFRLGATLLSFDYRVCGTDDLNGDTYAKVKWEVFSTRSQKVVYAVVVESSYSSSKSQPRREFDRAMMRAMVDNLLGDPKFVDVVLSGGAAQQEPSIGFAPLQLDAGRLVTGGIVKAANGLLAAVVTVESAVGSGSAFYVSHDGYLLTNQHVVADSKFVRIRLAGGRSLVGEVLRIDKERDVALVRTDPVSIDVLGLRREEGRIGEEVYALGSPFGDVLSGTVTRGVLSSRRVFEGVAYLQSDVAINPGSSGGPLIDANGQVLGIAQLGSRAQGINLFIPIDDALDKLGLKLSVK